MRENEGPWGGIKDEHGVLNKLETTHGGLSSKSLKATNRTLMGEYFEISSWKMCMKHSHILLNYICI